MVMCAVIFALGVFVGTVAGVVVVGCCIARWRSPQQIVPLRRQQNISLRETTQSFASSSRLTPGWENDKKKWLGLKGKPKRHDLPVRFVAVRDLCGNGCGQAPTAPKRPAGRRLAATGTYGGSVVEYCA